MKRQPRDPINDKLVNERWVTCVQLLHIMFVWIALHHPNLRVGHHQCVAVHLRNITHFTHTLGHITKLKSSILVLELGWSPSLMSSISEFGNCSCKCACVLTCLSMMKCHGFSRLTSDENTMLPSFWHSRQEVRWKNLLWLWQNNKHQS